MVEGVKTFVPEYFPEFSLDCARDLSFQWDLDSGDITDVGEEVCRIS